MQGVEQRRGRVDVYPQTPPAPPDIFPLQAWPCPRGTTMDYSRLLAPPGYIPPAGLAMSAGYDGRVIIWDLRAGIAASVFTQPEGMDPVRYLDGHWGPDGTTMLVSDEAGQHTIFATGA